MAMIARSKTDEIEDYADITSNLESLQFESALTDGEKDILNLRKRSHAHTVTVCAQATYYVAVLNEARQIQKELKNPTVRRATRIIQDATVKEIMPIGIIGCGRLGCHLAHSLLSFAEVNSNELFISTRRPETLIDLQEKGVSCVYSNADVASRVQLLFLCVLPSQFPAVAEDIKGHIGKGCIVYSLISALPIPRIKQLINYSNVIRPEYEWTELEKKVRWDYTSEVTGAFANRDLLEKTCPLSCHKDESVVWTKEKFAEQMIYAFVNMCTDSDFSRGDTVDILNAVVLGHTSSQPLTDSIQQDDITKYHPKGTEFFPYFDLSTTLNRDTPITKKLTQNQTVRDAFVQRYCHIFQQYLDWRKTALAQARKQQH